MVAKLLRRLSSSIVEDEKTRAAREQLLAELRRNEELLISEAEDEIDHVQAQLSILRDTNAQLTVQYRLQTEAEAKRLGHATQRLVRKLEMLSKGHPNVHLYAAAVRSVGTPRYVQGLQSKVCQRLHAMALVEGQLHRARKDLSKMTSFMKQQSSDMADESTGVEVQKLSQVSKLDMDIQELVKSSKECLAQQEAELRRLYREKEERQKQAAEKEQLIVPQAVPSSSATNQAPEDGESITIGTPPSSGNFQPLQVEQQPRQSKRRSRFFSSSNNEDYISPHITKPGVQKSVTDSLLHVREAFAVDYS